MDAALYSAVHEFLSWRRRTSGVRSMEFTQSELAQFVETLPPERAPELFVDRDRLARAIRAAREAGEITINAASTEPRLRIDRLRPPWDDGDVNGTAKASPIE